MNRRDFLGLGLGFVGLAAFSETTASAQTKFLQMWRPPEAAFAYANTSYQVNILRKKQKAFPRIDRIEFRYRGNLIGTVTQEPFTYNWVPTLADLGQSAFVATAYQAGTGAVIWTKSVNMQIAQLPSGVS